MVVLVYSMIMVIFEFKFIKFMKTLQASGGSVKQRRLREQTLTHVRWINYDRTFRNKRISSGSEINGGRTEDPQSRFLNVERHLASCSYPFQLCQEPHDSFLDQVQLSLLDIFPLCMIIYRLVECLV
jgi:hypothetical protein